MSQSPGDLLDKLRAETPLVQCITNYVAMSVTANVLLAAGASPAMVADAEEAGEFARIAGALTVNIGTLSKPMLEGARAAIEGAHGAGRPWVFDPVACQATAFRARASADLSVLKPAIIRANASEILSLAGEASQGQGVDGRDGVRSAEEAARRLARDTGAVIAVTGREDYVTNGARALRIGGGSHWMTLNTAMGCALTGLCGAFAAVADDPFDATVGALALFGVAGTRTHESASGPGGFGWRFIDTLHGVMPAALDYEAEISEVETIAA